MSYIFPRIPVALFFLCCCLGAVSGQTDTRLSGTIAGRNNQPVESGTVSLLKQKDSSLVKITTVSKNGVFELENLQPGNYLLQVNVLGFEKHTLPVRYEGARMIADTIFLEPASNPLGNVTVSSQKPFIEMKAGVTLINVEASPSNAGATALEVLEKSPGISVDKDGNISLKGKQNVLVWIDGKQTYLPAADLATMLSAMPASQLETIEIMTNPTAKYDAAGSTGIVHIRTKKLKTQGFNGNLTLNYGQGRYYKTNNSLMLNYRNQSVNVFFNYSLTGNRNFTDLYALRTYYANDDKTILSLYEQPGYLFGNGKNHTIKTGIDYNASKNTVLGIALSGVFSNRSSGGNSPAYWKNAAGTVDSSMITVSDNSTAWQNKGINLNLRHRFDKTSELAIDLDHLAYNTENNQYFINTLQPAGTSDALRGALPSSSAIYSGKADYSRTFANGLKWEAGWKSARVNTDNIAEYHAQANGGPFVPDMGKTNHFIYQETIHALYTNFYRQTGNITWQAGLRYENTAYNAHQKGNPLRKDSAFSRQYDGLFPTAMLTIQADSNHSFTFTAGRRIDRPAFPKLNPFVFVINKYTYQQGNPFFRPQYTWNFELTHNFRNKLFTSFSYGYTRDHFSQIFYAGSDNIIIYTEGNLGKQENIGVSVSTQLQPARIWSLNISGSFNHKKLEGYVWSDMRASINTLNINLNNQFKLNRGWAFEVSGFFNTGDQELQEVTDPFGQLTVGVSKQLLKNKATVRMNVRDIFYTQWMKGWTTFQHATEYFKLTRDTRVLNIAFTWRFGKTFKDNRRQSGASEESQRMGNG